MVSQAFQHNVGQVGEDPGVVAEDPFAIHSCRGMSRHDNFTVTFGAGNVRNLIFQKFPGYVQTSVQCAGDLPEGPAHGTIHGRCDDPAVVAALQCKKPVFDNKMLKQTWLYDSILAPLVSTCGAKPAKILMLGLGGGAIQSYIKEQCPDSVVTTIEHDAKVVSVARSFFGFDGGVFVQDASSALRDLAKLGKKYDNIFVDITDHRLSKTDAKHLAKLLEPSGKVIENWNLRPEGTANLRNHRRDLKGFFNEVRSAEDGGYGYNTVIYAGKPAAKDNSAFDNFLFAGKPIRIRHELDGYVKSM